VALDLGDFVPPGLIERLLAACYCLGTHRYFWRTALGGGALITIALAAATTAEARLLLDVETIAHDVETTAPDEDVPQDEEPLRDMRDVDTVAMWGATTQAAADERSARPPEYALRFEVFAPAAYEAAIDGILAKAQALLIHLLREFPGMVASPLHGPPKWRVVRARERIEAPAVAT